MAQMHMEDLHWVEVNDPEQYRDIILQEHRAGGFRGDDHKMDLGFTLKKTHISFHGAVGCIDDQVACFCACEVFQTSQGKLGYIRCQGVPIAFRGKGLSLLALQACETMATHDHPNMVKLTSTCNPVSAHVHEKDGWVVTNPGHLSKTGKLCMIKLEKQLQ